MIALAAAAEYSRAQEYPRRFHVLYCTTDIQYADYLEHELRRAKSGLKIVVCADFRLVVDKLRTGNHHAVLVDHEMPLEKRLLLIADIQKLDVGVCIIAMVSKEKADADIQAMQAAADAWIVRSRGFAQDLPAVVQSALKRRQAGVARHLAHSGATVSAAPPKEADPVAPGTIPSIPCPAAAGSKSSAEANKRAFARRQVHFECEVQFDGETKKGQIHDISVGGTFLETDASPPIGQEVVIAVQTPKTLKLTGTIMHHGWFLTATRNFEGFGVQFHDLTPEDLEGVCEICERQSEPAQAKVQLER
jgi:DNA-binding response OmpR family regulator